MKTDTVKQIFKSFDEAKGVLLEELSSLEENEWQLEGDDRAAAEQRVTEAAGELNMIMLNLGAILSAKFDASKRTRETTAAAARIESELDQEATDATK